MPMPGAPRRPGCLHRRATPRALHNGSGAAGQEVDKGSSVPGQGRGRTGMCDRREVTKVPPSPQRLRARNDFLSGFRVGREHMGDMGYVKSDAELVEASRRGEREAFGDLVTRYQDVVCAVSYSS